jgi:hypothetical protein
MLLGCRCINSPTESRNRPRDHTCWHHFKTSTDRQCGSKFLVRSCKLSWDSQATRCLAYQVTTVKGYLALNVWEPTA